MPAAVTTDGRETQILTSLAQGLVAAGFHSLQLGKPGIEFHTGWDTATFAYDKALYLKSTWKDLLTNVEEAIAFVATRHPCGASTIVLVGHSEGTMRISDVAKRNPKVRGLVFIGFFGRNFRDMVEWQAYRRPVELFVEPDVDADHDGYITRDEASKWPNDFTHAWKEGETRISVAAYAESLRSNPATQKAVNGLATGPLFSNGIWERAPTYHQVALLPIPVLAFTGSLDVVTPPSELKELEAACKSVGKLDCETHLVPGLGHGMSGPRPPRAHPYLDQTEGPVDPQFLELFTRTLLTWRTGIRSERSHH